MKKSIFGGAVIQLIFVSSLLVFQVPAQSNNTISGHVFNPARQPLTEVYVELLNEVNSIIGRRKTTSGGRYVFTGLTGGTFTIRVLTGGLEFEEQSFEVSISSNGVAGRSPTESIQQDFYLRSRRSSSGKSVTGTVFAQEIPEESRKLYDNAVDNFSKNNSVGGVQSLEAAIKLFPTYYLALERLAQEYAAQEKWELAYDLFKRSVAVNSRSFASLYGLSVTASKLQKNDEAMNAAKEAVSISADSVEAQLLLGINQRKAKLFNEAEKSLKEAEKLAKGKSMEPDVHWNLALLYAYNLVKYNFAADQLELYLKAKPDLTDKETIKKLIKQFRDKASANN
jgi:tetratricopeptide (TPR) repeat protein